MLYLMFKASNVSLNIILCVFYSRIESNNGQFTSDLQNKWKETRTFKLSTYCEQASIQ